MVDRYPPNDSVNPSIFSIKLPGTLVIERGPVERDVSALPCLLAVSRVLAASTVCAPDRHGSRLCHRSQRRDIPRRRCGYASLLRQLKAIRLAPSPKFCSHPGKLLRSRMHPKSGARPCSAPTLQDRVRELGATVNKASDLVSIVQVSDTHISRKRAYFFDNWEVFVDEMRRQPPDLIVHSGDVSFDGAGDEDDIAFARMGEGSSVRAVDCHPRQPRYRRATGSRPAGATRER